MPVATTELEGHFPAITMYLSAAALGSLAEALSARDLAAGVALLVEGVASDSLYLLREGELAVSMQTAAGEKSLGRMSPGAIVGEVSLMDPGPASATVRALTPARVLCLGRDELAGLAARRPTVATAVLRALCTTVAGRIRNADARYNYFLRQSGLAGAPAGEQRPATGEYFNTIYSRGGGQ